METLIPTHVAAQIFGYAVIAAMCVWFVFSTGIDNTAHTYQTKTTLKLLSFALLLAWFFVIELYARQGGFAHSGTAGLWRLALAVVGPPVIAAMFLVSPLFVQVLDRMSLAWFAAVSAFRILFAGQVLALIELGKLPQGLAFLAGYCEILVGFVGLVGGYLWMTRSPGAYTVAVLWEVTGFLVYLLAIPLWIEILTAQPLLAGLHHSTYLIPGYVAPLFLITHVYTVRALVIRRGNF